MWDEIIFNRENMSYDDSLKINREKCNIGPSLEQHREKVAKKEALEKYFEKGEEDYRRWEEYINEQRTAFDNNEIQSE